MHLLSLLSAHSRLPVKRHTGDREGRQQGGIFVMAAIFLSIIVILLSAIDIGYLFYKKRDLQKVADLAALAGAQALSKAAFNCSAAGPAATFNANLNNFSIVAPNVSTNTIATTCGRWDPQTTPALSTVQTYEAPLAKNFGTPKATINFNAVKVIVSANVSGFFGLRPQIVVAQAIASVSDPYAAFSVGSELLGVKGGVVPGLLSALGLNINGTSLVSYKGLASVSVAPSGLLKALGFEIPLHADVGTVRNILQLTTSGCSAGVCTLEALLGAVSTVGGQQNLVSALGLSVSQLSLKVPLLSDASGRGGLLTLNAADGQSALNASLSALNVVSTAIGIANNQNFGKTAVGISLPPLVSISAQMGIVEPPSIGIGGLGTTAYTAQVRLYARIKASLPAVLNVDLPIIIDLVNGMGTLTKLCTTKDSGGNDQAEIAVQAPLVSLCVGGINGATSTTTPPIDDPLIVKTVFSTQGVCKSNMTDYPMVSLLGTTLVSKPITIDALPNNAPPLTLIKNQTLSTQDNGLQIGTTVSALLNSLLGTVLSAGSTTTSDNLATALLGSIGNTANSVLNYTNGALKVLQTFVNSVGSGNLLASVGTLVGGLLNSLGNLLGGILGGLIGPCSIFSSAATCVASTIPDTPGTGGQPSSLLLTVLGLVVNLLNGLGGALSGLLTQLGIHLGVVDVNLMDLNCGGGSVSLVY
ncbi:pilus assembly protein TadG-related protein [Glaciimonas sp. PCH181]|uniref:pilus assembly protein TadG-related protein n=1 Tax=Glaciimonas sp. PCH181 TaxID=2133943 RepID=UPI000D3D8D63|nr:pilus assembly protein TadG-related protein [Glaciimonas sp. PCH181]PUA19804.1 hypothetical protein C7W93_08275 [Glaciimonas sp. PCH181]